MPPVARTVGETIDALIAEGAGGITSQRKLARRLAELDQREKVSSWERSIKRWRRGESTPSPASIMLLCEAFDVPRSRFPASDRPSLRMVLRRQEALEAELSELRLVVEAGFRFLGLQVVPGSPQAGPKVVRTHPRLRAADD
jgi:transcriptional regulator with XRE-family HTH domain